MKHNNKNNLEIELSKLDKVYYNNQRVYNVILNGKFIWFDKIDVKKDYGNSNTK
tara:strand:+ start:89 stop:250 length:162 start_codon:yes stop_codon:yes gene_type:complete